MVKRWFNMMRPSAAWLALFLLVIIPILLFSVFIGIRSGLFHSSAKPLTSDELKAFWTFAGVGITAAVSVTGYMITNNQEKKNQHRLALDTTVSGLRLVTNQEGTGYAPMAAVAGALATLINLDQPTIAMRALFAAWRDGAIDSASAVWLVSEIMRVNDGKIQLEAARLLSEQADSLCGHNPGEFSWPPTLFEQWIPSMPLDARIYVICALLKTLISKPLSWWDESESIGWAIATLDEAILKDSSPYVGSLAANSLDVLLKAIDEEEEVLSFIGGEKKYKDIRRRLAPISRDWTTAYYDNLELQLKSWVSGT